MRFICQVIRLKQLLPQVDVGSVVTRPRYDKGTTSSFCHSVSPEADPAGSELVETIMNHGAWAE